VNKAARRLELSRLGQRKAESLIHHAFCQRVNRRLQNVGAGGAVEGQANAAVTEYNR
jgi:hypothetical protein